ncbi:hypothetical protein DBV15_12680, partial [Temnothorax longispinosus]
MFIRTECEVEILEEYAEDDTYDDNLLTETTIQEPIITITEDNCGYDDNLLPDTTIQEPRITQRI